MGPRLSAPTSITFRSESPEETARFGARLARVLRAGDVVLLEGELGAGKTTLVRAVCSALGVPERAVSSPTFVTVNEYEGRANGKEHVIVHADGYRLLGGDGSGGDSDSLGLDAIDPAAIVMIEWAEQIERFAERETITIRIRHTGVESREIRVDGAEAWGDREGIDELGA
jgi:tRNA threonylcarbamoyladenosine biosynthesis protein TsaE